MLYITVSYIYTHYYTQYDVITQSPSLCVLIYLLVRTCFIAQLRSSYCYRLCFKLHMKKIDTRNMQFLQIN